MKRIAMLLVSIMLFVSLFPSISLAAGDGDEIEPMALASSSVSISASGRSVTYTANATYTKQEPSIKVTLTLQENRDGVWYNIDSGSKSVANTISITYSRTKAVTGGHYYRAMAVFAATNSGTKTIYSTEKRVS